MQFTHFLAQDGLCLHRKSHNILGRLKIPPPPQKKSLCSFRIKSVEKKKLEKLYLKIYKKNVFIFHGCVYRPIKGRFYPFKTMPAHFRYECLPQLFIVPPYAPPPSPPRDRCSGGLSAGLIVEKYPP